MITSSVASAVAERLGARPIRSNPHGAQEVVLRVHADATGMPDRAQGNRAQGHPRLGPGRPVRCARQAPERAGEAERRPIPARLRLRPDQGGGRAAGEQTERGQAALRDRGFHQPPGHHGHKHATVEYVRGVCLGPAGDLRRLGFPEDNGCRQVGDRRRDLIRVAIYVFAALSRISSPSARNRLRFVARRCSCGSQRSSYWVRVEHVVPRPTPT